MQESILPLRQAIGEKSVAGLKRKQRRTLKFIKKVYSSALNIKDRDKNFFLPVHFEWLCDNYYIIERELKSVYKSLAGVRKLPAVSGNIPRIYAYLDRLTEKTEGEITGDMLTGYIKSAQADGNYFYIDELRLAGVMLSAALCERIYGVCVILKDFLDGKIKSVPDELAYSIGFAIKNLRFCEMYQFEKLFSECSKIDEILNRDPGGYYPSMTKTTKDYYRFRLSALAKKRRADEISTAEEILSMAEEHKLSAANASGKDKTIHEKKSHVGYFLLQKSAPRNLYFFSIVILTLAITALIIYASKTVLSLLLIFPVWEFVKQITDLTFSRSLGASPIPKLDFASVPEDKKTLVCVTTLLFGEGKDDKLYERLELFYHANKDKNIRFAVVGDLKDNKDEFTDQDAKIIEYAKAKIRGLNEKYPDKFCLFIRGRVYSKTQGRFMGWERKRGAIIELVRFIKGIKTSVDVFEGNEEFVRDLKYVITLDADTDLALDSAKEMIAAMSHPNALPVYDAGKKIVTDGYGIMQPKMGTELSAAAKTPFTRMLCGSGGLDIYESAAFDLYQELYGEGNFCGKGIFDADIFYKTIDDAYPEETVLSHDLLEGTRMRACLISDLELTDGIPKNAMSYYDRLHRWIRGDVQALFFAFGKTKNADGETIDNPISALSSFKLFDNVRRAATPVISVIFLFLALIFVPDGIILPLASLAVLYIVFPLMANLCVIILTPSFQNISKKFSSKVMTSVWQSFANVFFELSALGYKAVLSADAIIRSLIRRLITKKNLMSWQTASESELKLTGLPLYLRKSAPSMILGLVMIFAAPFGLYKAMGAMWALFPFLAYYTGTEAAAKKLYDPEVSKKEIKNYVTDMWKFYAAAVKKQDNFLPPDNIQLYPAETTAHRTSPTNIGLYLLSCLAAHDYGLIDIKTLYAKVDATISTIERMEKWNGHLYNWYDTKKLEVIGSKFVSTVDSGNFCAALTSLKEGLRTLPEFDSLVMRIEKILENTFFSFLYNQKRELFYIGYDGEKEEFGSNCYDLYMSEAKITSYFAIARREVPKKHWGRLSRTLIKDGGYMGLASWTGTAFEYYMANLLLPLYKDSLTFEANKFALREQIKRTAKYDGTEVWGISESGFYAFDFDMNYQYMAFGVQKLGLKRGLNKELVISPYSSFLALSISPRRALNNLRRLKKIGMYGKYGFYEAADFTRSRVSAGVGIVRSYMAHHVGMSIVACANLSFDNIFQKRFMSDKTQWSANELLQEKIPVDAIIFEDIDRREIPEKINRSYAAVKNNTGGIDLKNPVINQISNTKAKILTSSSGHILMTDENKMINYCDFNRYNELRPFAAMVKYGDSLLSPSKTPFIRESAEYSYTFTDISTAFHAREKIGANFISAEAKYTVSSDVSCYSVALTVSITSESKGKPSRNRKGEDVEAMLYFEPVLVPSGDYFAHPAFSALSVECEYDEAENILIYKRRPRLESESEVFLAVTVRDTIENNNRNGKKQSQVQSIGRIEPFTFESRRDEILPHAYEADDIKNLFFTPFKNTTGACINPVCAVKVKLPKSEDGGKRAVIFDIASAKSYDEAVRILKEKRSGNNLSGERKETEKSLISVRNRRHSAEITQNGLNLHDIVLSSLHAKTIHNRPGDLTSYSAASVKSLWKAGISGDLPIALIIFEDDKKADELTEFLHVYKYMSLSGEKCDFAVLYSETEPYGRPRHNKLRELIKRTGCEPFLNRKGGIFLLYSNELEEDTISALNILASYKRKLTASLAEAERKIISPEENPLTNIPKIQKYRTNDSKLNRFNPEEKIFGVEGGYFTKNSFVADCKDKKAPWSHIITNRQFGTCVTKSSLGFTWVSNARERRITPWDNDPVAGMSGERLVLILNGNLYDVIKSSLYFVISPNKADYHGRIEGLEYKATVSVDAKLAVKIISCEFYSDPDYQGQAELCYVASPVMGVARSKTNSLRFFTPSGENGDTICFENICNADFKGYKGFVKALGGYKKAFDFAEFLTNGSFNCHESDCAAVACEMSFSPRQTEQKSVFLLGCYKSEKNYFHIVSAYRNYKDADSAIAKSEEFIRGFMPEINLSCNDKAMEAMFNVWLPYQTVAARIFGRTGFYQSSGAYGFRDQLQDMLCILYSSPSLVKTHIFRAAAHQFIEGDVLHWWHNLPGNDEEPACRGVRTRCSDDYLWLAYMVCEYIKFTGDYAVLDVKVRYIESEPLKSHEKERYHEPKISGVSESVFEHCVKAIEYGLNFGSHGLPLIGTCDWNDGMSLVGAEGKGESVWLAFFLRIVLIRFAEICEYAKRKDLADKYIAESGKLRENIELHCYEDDQYIRGFYDDGKKLGSKFNDECKIDLLPQSFAAIASKYDSAPIPDRITAALESAYKELYDNKAKILKLFTPPFISGEQEPGYIKGYVAGIRENGGQYTHGAVWGALGFFAGGQKERGYELLQALNPAKRCESKEAADIYRAEPYVMAGDVYSNAAHTGRGGWSWYTGASSWYYKIIAENLLGIDVTHGEIRVQPAPPEGLEIHSLTFNEDRTRFCHP